MMKIAVLLLATLCLANAQKFPINAVALIGGAIIDSNMQEPVMIFGDAKFSQQSAQAPVIARLNITFMPTTNPIVNQLRGFHVHSFGISNNMNEPSQTCESAGPHWNPTGTNHGSVTDLRSHLGDLGNVQPVNGRIVTQITSQKLQLFGENSIIGRSVVLHERADDQGLGNVPMSLKSGNSGSRIACGTIGIVN
ncbi:unnamed protein product [Brachionus calyciflorus]|uniref:Superoxide dismutase [Cu-Zn] n=1 Tax=Brachionus calyciflorus TaxID=104777 RepID=A0A813V071_9BILA|nr:unnamed protein product [Brachionus calyciflorus]